MTHCSTLLYFEPVVFIAGGSFLACKISASFTEFHIKDDFFMRHLFKRLFHRPGPGTMMALNLAGLNGIFWFSMSFTSFLTVYLQQNGFSASQLGLLNAIASVVAIGSASFWGMVSDKIHSVKKVLILILILGNGLYMVTPLIPTDLAYSTLLLLIFVPFINFFRGSMANMVDNTLVRNCSEMRLNFGVIRSAGSFLYTLGGLTAAQVVASMGLDITFFLNGILMIPAICLAFFTREPNQGSGSKKKKEKLDLSGLFKNYPYMSFLVFTFLFYIAISGEASFIPYFMESVGASTDKYSILLAYRALLEIPFLLLTVKLHRRFQLKHLIMAAGCLMACECLCFALFARSFESILVFCTFFGLGNGLFIGSALYYIYGLAPDHLKASAQSFFLAMQAVSGIFGNIVGGMLFDALGAQMFYFTVSMTFLLSVAIFALSFLIRPGKNKPQQVTT